MEIMFNEWFPQLFFNSWGSFGGVTLFGKISKTWISAIEYGWFLHIVLFSDFSWLCGVAFLFNIPKSRYYFFKAGIFFYFPLHLFLTSNGDIYLFPWNDWPWDSFLKNTKFLRWNFYLIWSEKTKYFAMSCKMKLVFQIFYKLIITIHYYLKCKKHLKANLLFYLYSCKRNYILNKNFELKWWITYYFTYFICEKWS